MRKPKLRPNRKPKRQARKASRPLRLLDEKALRALRSPIGTVRRVQINIRATKVLRDELQMTAIYNNMSLQTLVLTVLRNAGFEVADQDLNSAREGRR